VSYSGGIFVRVQNAQHFDLIYRHLSKVHVKKGETPKRGQLIGLSAASNDGVSHLHFRICKVGGSLKKLFSNIRSTEILVRWQAEMF
jgi:murein DD-endopeptidase MepM/ murein hydrolase activator NlpD